MRIGYACLTIGVENAKLQHALLRTINEEKLYQIIDHNLNVLEKVLRYNRAHGIFMFRMSSDLIPFGSSYARQFSWRERFSDRLQAIGNYIQHEGIRVSMHPGQYTVLNSPRFEVVEAAIADLDYHAEFMDALGVDASHKIILHIGGVYGDRLAAMKRFGEVYRMLSERVKARLVIENDDVNYPFDDVYQLAVEWDIPMVFDNLHHEVLPSPSGIKDLEAIELARKTWAKRDGVQKIHYSQQHANKAAGAHSDTIALIPFLKLLSRIQRNDLDVMLEVKDKNLSAVKANLAVQSATTIQDLEREWARYKYAVLEHDPTRYEAIRMLLKDKQIAPVLEFYDLVDSAIDEPIQIGRAENALRHVFGHLSNKMSEKERLRFNKLIDSYRSGARSLKACKNYLWKFVVSQNELYLRQSLYFSVLRPTSDMD